jgi:fructuronate reductase
LEQIAHDGSVKLPQRLLPSLAINHEAGRASPKTCLAIAAWMRFVMQRARAGTAIVDPLAGKLVELAAQEDGRDVERLLSLPEIFPQWIGRDSMVREQIAEAYDVLCAQGVHSALSAVKKACKV